MQNKVLARLILVSAIGVMASDGIALGSASADVVGQSAAITKASPDFGSRFLLESEATKKQFTGKVVKFSLARLANLKNYSFTSVIYSKGQESTLSARVYSQSNFEITEPGGSIFYVAGKGYKLTNGKTENFNIKSPSLYIQQIDQYAWAKVFLNQINAKGATWKAMGTCLAAGISGNKYVIVQKSRGLTKIPPTACIATKSGVLLWYKSNTNALEHDKFVDLSFSVTSVGNIKPIALPKVNAQKVTTTTLPKILHYIPSSFPSSIPKPPGVLSGAYVEGSPNYIWIVITTPRSTTDVTKYITSLRQLGFKPYGEHYTNYTTTLRNTKYQITVSYETLGPAVVEMTTSLALLKG